MAPALVGSLFLAAAFAQSPDTVITLGPPTRLDHPFASITGARVLDDGRLLVTDRRERQFGIVDDELRTFTRIGREGRGPGEYVGPTDLIAMPNDSTALVDPGQMRLTIYTPTRLVASSRHMLEGNTLFWPTGAPRNFWVYHDPDVNAGIVDGKVLVMRADRRGGRPEVVATLNVPPELYPGRARQGWGPPRVGFFVRDTYAVGTDGWIGVVRYSPYRVDWIAPDKTLRAGTPRVVTPTPVLNEDKLEWAAEQSRRVATLFDDRGGTNRAPTAKPDITGVTFPRTFPPFREEGALVAANGDLWVRRFLPDRLRRTEYDLFSRSGTFKAVLRLIGIQRVLAVTKDAVWLAVQDDDAEWLEKRPFATARSTRR